MNNKNSKYISNTTKSIEIYKEFIAELINKTTSILQNPPPHKNSFQAALIGISMRDNLCLYSIYKLSESKYNGDAILDLSRKLIEDMIGIEFMKLKGAEKTARQFFDYIYVEQKITHDFLKKSDVRKNKKLDKQTIDNYEQVKKDFMFRKNEIAKSWAKCTLEQMIEELIKAKAIDADDKDMLLLAYTMGNRKNHLSPFDVFSFRTQELRDVNQAQSAEAGMIVAILCYLRVITQFLEKFGYTDLARDLAKQWSKINSK